MRHRRPLLILSLLAVVSAAALAFVDWRPLLVHYRCWRLERCREPGEAGPWMDALARDVTRPAAAEMVVAKMGAEHQWLTVWTWREVFRPQGRPGLLSLVQAMARRWNDDSRFMREIWHFQHFLGWHRCSLETEEEATSRPATPLPYWRGPVPGWLLPR